MPRYVSRALRDRRNRTAAESVRRDPRPAREARAGSAPPRESRSTPGPATPEGTRRPAADAADTVHRLRRLAVVLAAAVSLTGALAGYAWHAARDAAARRDAARDAVAAARTATQAIFSYDHRAFDDSVAAGKRFVTGEFAEEYAETTRGLKATAEREQAVVRAEVSAAGVVTATAGRVEVLLYVDRYRRDATVTGEKVDQNRVVLTMRKVGRDWKVTKAAAI